MTSLLPHRSRVHEQPHESASLAARRTAHLNEEVERTEENDWGIASDPQPNPRRVESAVVISVTALVLAGGVILGPKVKKAVFGNSKHSTEVSSSTPLTPDEQRARQNKLQITSGKIATIRTASIALSGAFGNEVWGRQHNRTDGEIGAFAQAGPNDFSGFFQRQVSADQAVAPNLVRAQEKSGKAYPSESAIVSNVGKPVTDTAGNVTVAATVALTFNGWLPNGAPTRSETDLSGNFVLEEDQVDLSTGPTTTWVVATVTGASNEINSLEPTGLPNLDALSH